MFIRLHAGFRMNNKKKFNIAIADDEPLALEHMMKLLNGFDEFKVKGVFQTGNSVEDFLFDNQVDATILDINMPGKNGLSVAENLSKLQDPPLVVFITAYHEYAYQGFDLGIVDYLVKPYSDERFAIMIQRLRDALAPKNNASTEDFKQSMLVETDKDKLIVLKMSDILWVEAANVYVKIYTNNETHLQRATFTGFMDSLNPQNFIRIHRSYSINIDAIAEVERYSAHDYSVILHSGKCLPIGRNYKQAFFNRFGL